MKSRSKIHPEKSAFLSWFVSQFGPRPGTRQTDEKLKVQAGIGDMAHRMLNERLRWDRNLQAASYGWQAREKQPK